MDNQDNIPAWQHLEEEYDIEQRNSRIPSVGCATFVSALVVAIVALVLILAFCVPKADAATLDEPDCHLLWTIPSCRYCNDYEPYGDYFLYICQDSEDSWFYSECGYTSSVSLKLSYLPLINKE